MINQIERNVLAKRNIQNVGEVIRTTLHAYQLPQRSWKFLLKSVTFALNTTICTAIKSSPYKIVHGREAIMPLAVELGVSSRQDFGDLNPAQEFARILNDNLKEICTQVNRHLKVYREDTRKKYNRNIRIHEYDIGQKVYLQAKCFRTGESIKLAPRKTGP